MHWNRVVLIASALGCGAAESPPPVPASTPQQSAPAPTVKAKTKKTRSTGPRLVAVGDLHGDPDNALSVLQLAGIADKNGNWTGGNAILVQTGDTTDRGPDSKGVLDLVRKLREQAPKSGGRVVALLGNHEAMNLTGDWRYVSPGDLTTFGGQENRRRALSPQGEYGKFLYQSDAVALVQGTVFVHGGVRPEFARLGIDGINAAVRAALSTGRDAVLGPDGPLWYRGYVEKPEAQACPELMQALELLNAERMVVGHTTRRNGRIQSRCDGRLAVIDIGISDHYGANLGAWQSVDGDATAIYPSGPAQLPDP